MLKGSPARKTVAALSQKKRPPQPNCQFQEKPWSCLGKTFFPPEGFHLFYFFKVGSGDKAVHLYHSIPNLSSRIKVLPSLTYMSGFSCSSCIREKSGVSREMCLAGYWTLTEDGNIDKYTHTRAWKHLSPFNSVGENILLQLSAHITFSRPFYSPQEQSGIFQTGVWLSQQRKRKQSNKIILKVW